jgi:Fe-S oxidoreductase
MGEYETPRRVIKSKSKLIEMDRNRERSRCCGAGGGVRSANPDKSMAMAQQRVEDAIETGAELIISCCPFCRLNLDENGNMKVIDLTEFIGGKNETF